MTLPNPALGNYPNSQPSKNTPTDQAVKCPSGPAINTRNKCSIASGQEAFSYPD